MKNKLDSVHSLQSQQPALQWGALSSLPLRPLVLGFYGVQFAVAVCAVAGVDIKPRESLLGFGYPAPRLLTGLGWAGIPCQCRLVTLSSHYVLRRSDWALQILKTLLCFLELLAESHLLGQPLAS